MKVPSKPEYVPVKLGDVRPISSFLSPAGSSGTFVELDRPGHGCSGLLIWRMEGEERSPEQEAFARHLIKAVNAHEELIAALKAERRLTDWLLARLIELDVSFLPSRAPHYDECNSGYQLLKRLGEAE